VEVEVEAEVEVDGGEQRVDCSKASSANSEAISMKRAYTFSRRSNSRRMRSA
jgi:hypothetical protein